MCNGSRPLGGGALGSIGSGALGSIGGGDDKLT